MKVWIGIDPGKDGSIAYITDEGKRGAVPTPKIGIEYDLNKMHGILKMLQASGSCHVVLENINSHSAKGRQGAFVMGKGVAYWEAFIVALGLPYTRVTPQAWQKVVWEGVKVQFVPSSTNKSGKKKDTKATSMVAAKRLFPDFDFTPTERAEKLHDGMIDAMLMAEYCKRRF